MYIYIYIVFNGGPTSGAKLPKFARSMADLEPRSGLVWVLKKRFTCGIRLLSSALISHGGT